MKLDNESFWNEQDVIQSQDKNKSPKLYPYEKRLLEMLPINRLSTPNIQVFGCGTGRELPDITRYFPQANITASDIAQNMIIKCNENLKEWGIDRQIKTELSPSESINVPSNSSDLITVFNNMLTYILPASQRDKVLANAHRILKKDAYLIGVVHNQNGKLLKTLFFVLQKLFAPLLPIEQGDRTGGFLGKRVQTHYFNIKEVKSLLQKNGFDPILVTDLVGLYLLDGKKVNRRKSDNNIVFIGKKRL